jgi:hypothetical protein
MKKTKAGPSQVEILAGRAEDVKLFYDPVMEAGFAVMWVVDHREVWGLQSKAFSRWLTSRYLVHVGKPPSPHAVRMVVAALEAACQFHGYAHQETALRVAGG